jgi:hypothetical protein
MRRKYIDDDEARADVARDGEVIRTPMRFMDAAARRFADHQPGYRLRDAADRQAVRDAREQMIRRAENAWRDARRKRDDDDDDDDDDEPDNSNDRSISDGRAMAMRKASYLAWRARLADAWRMSPTTNGPGSAAAEELLRRHLGDHENPRIPDPTDPGDPNENLIRRHLSTETNAGAQAERDRAWNRYRDNLQNAWRGTTNPANATAIEKQAEAWRGGK